MCTEILGITYEGEDRDTAHVNGKLKGLNLCMLGSVYFR